MKRGTARPIAVRNRAATLIDLFAVSLSAIPRSSFRNWDVVAVTITAFCNCGPRFGRAKQGPSCGPVKSFQSRFIFDLIFNELFSCRQIQCIDWRLHTAISFCQSLALYKIIHHHYPYRSYKPILLADCKHLLL